MPDIVILGTQGFSQHQKPLLEHFEDRITVESDYRPSKIASHEADLIISFEASNSQRGLCIAEMARQGAATLQIMDGITEWRNTWTRRVLPYQRPLNQPVLAHKVACLGQADARIFESWGNVGKCEVVGHPRLDHLVRLNKKMRIDPIEGRPLRLLIMTARTPGFTADEVETTYQALKDLGEQLADRSDVQIVWRTTKGLHKRLGVKNTFTEATGHELHDILGAVDAVITTPSTAMLEGMLFGHPVAILNYHRVPIYIPAAWEINCKNHILPVVNDLKKPPLERMLYQEYCLNDALSCRTPAMPRLVELIEKMIAIRRDQLSSGREQIEFPHRILVDPDQFVSWPSEKFNLEELYPNHPVFGQSEVLSLQTELDSALNSIEQVKEQVDILTRRLHKIPGYLFAKKIGKSLNRTTN